MDINNFPGDIDGGLKRRLIVEHRIWSKCPHDGKYQDHADSVCFLTCPDSISVPCFKRWDRKEMEMLEAMDRA